MATPPDSPIEEVVYELETTSRAFPKPVPVALEDLCRLTKFTRQEIRVMYRGFKVKITHNKHKFIKPTKPHTKI
jgi:Kv channel-interacting protein